MRLSSQDTPVGGRMMDVGPGQLQGVVRRLDGPGLTPYMSTPVDANPPRPPEPDVTAVIQPTSLPQSQTRRYPTRSSRLESDSSVNSDLPDPETSYSLQRRVRCTQGCPNPVLARYMTDHMRRVHRM